MTERQQAVVVSLLSVARKHGKPYCYPSQYRLEELLKTFQKIDISNRTLNRDLRALEVHGYIKRVRRVRRDRKGKLFFTSTLYKFTGKLFNWLYSVGKRVQRFFTFYRLPRMADNQLTQLQASSGACTTGARGVIVRLKDGSVASYDPKTGELIAREVEKAGAL